MKKITKRIVATATTAFMMLSMSALGASAKNVSTTLVTHNGCGYWGTIAARNRSFEITKCKGQKLDPKTRRYKNVIYNYNMVPDYPAKYIMKGNSQSNTISLCKYKNTKTLLVLSTEIETYNTKTKRKNVKSSCISTRNAGCGVSINRQPGNKALRYTLIADVSPHGDAAVGSSRSLILTVKQN